MKQRLLCTLTLSALALLGAAGARATNLVAPLSNSPVIDGASTRLDGTLHDTNGNTQPWTAELYVDGSECMRLFVTSTEFDAKLAVIAPNGAVYRDDNSGGANRPLVRIAGAPVRGWYTVQVAQANGLPSNSNFTLLYGRYLGGNVNCSGGTGPLAEVVSSEAADKDASLLEAQALRPGAP